MRYRSKYTKRSAVIINSLLFIVFSLFFLSVMESLEEGVSALDVKGFLSFLDKNTFLLITASITFVAVFFLTPFGPAFFLLFCGVTLYKSALYFLIDFDKLILILSFCYIMICYNFYQFLKLELKEPFYNPNFPFNIIPTYENTLIPIKINKNGVEYQAHLTNWAKNGFFCKLADNGNLRGVVEIEVVIENHSFFAEGQVVTSISGGVGIKIRKSLIPEMGWTDFYGIINELGYKPF